MGSNSKAGNCIVVGGQKEPQIFVGRYVVPYMFVVPHILIGRSSHTCWSYPTHTAQFIGGHHIFWAKEGPLDESLREQFPASFVL